MKTDDIVLFFSCLTGTVQVTEMAFWLYTFTNLYRYTLTSNNENN